MADNIKVNANDWSNLSSDDQQRVTNILTATGLLKSGSNVTPDAKATAAAAGPGGGAIQPAGLINFCKIGCDLAEAAAVAACAALSGPVAAACIAAAHAGGEICRNQC